MLTRTHMFWLAFPVVAALSASHPFAYAAAKDGQRQKTASLPAQLAFMSGVALIPREKLLGNPDKASPRISPDGRRLAFLAPVEGVLNVWVGPIDKPDEARPVTHDKVRGIRIYQWAYDNRQIIYLQDVAGNENWHVYAVDLERGQTTDLTPLENVRAEIEEISDRIPDKIIVGLNDRDPEVHDLYEIVLATAERRLIQKNTERFSGFVVDDDYRVRFAQKLDEEGDSLLLKPDGQNGWRQFMKISSADALTTHPIAFDQTGQILYMIDSRDRNTGALTAYNLEAGQENVIAQSNLADISGVLMTPREHKILAASYNYERTTWEILDPAVRADFDTLRQVTRGDVEIVSQSLDDRHWIVAYLLDDGPIRYYHYDRDSRAAHFLFTNRNDLEKLPLVRMHAVVIKSRDGFNLVSYLSLPRNAAADESIQPREPLAMVLDVHGGPWARDTWGFNPEHQLWANRGYAVLSVNFRGSTGLGKEFINAGNRQWAGKMHDDLVDAVRWAVDQKIADPRRIAITGGSYGGYATLVGLTFTPELFACGVDIVGPSNILTLLNTIPPYWKPVIQMFRTRVGDYTTEAGRKFLEERSPLNFVDRIRRPLLIGQGANDPRVKQAESDQIVKAMQGRNIPVTYVLFPDEGHGFVRPANRLAFYAVTEAFLAEHLGGRYQPIGDAFQGSTIRVPTGAQQVPGLPAALESTTPSK